jgi:cellulose synthase/poly-beta-1,6-N-acetylglucosamine synthase-like glycosyltransferase
MNRPAMDLGAILVAEGALTEEALQEALEIQRQTGGMLSRILIARGFISSDALAQAVARHLGLPFIDLRQVTPDEALLQRFDPEELLEGRFLPFALEDGRVKVAVADFPNEDIVRAVQAVLGEVAIEFLLTSDWDIDRAIISSFRTKILDMATFGLYYRRPDESAYTVLTPAQFVILIVVILIFIVAVLSWPAETLAAFLFIANFIFLSGILFKFVVSLAGAKYETMEPVTRQEVEALQDKDLPMYTILVPVYKEANIVGKLVSNLSSLDYPPEKLEILLLMEEDDQETIEAARRSNPPGTVTMVIIPDGQPKTKPKACNVGLFLARGDYLVIYDAEDRPEPDQLKKAVVAFEKGPESMACVQAALNYFNAYENFLTRMFTLEYSYWFDYMLPGLDRLKLPIPLGGTSNHFRTRVLRQLGGWDPFNVTEDADLGIRASANGYTVGVINSTTYEEANNEVRNWVRQRSRWIKGYMQTTLVHLRHPVRLLRQIGLKSAVGFLLLIGGTPLIFLISPLLWVQFVVWAIFEPQFLVFSTPMLAVYISLINFLVGNGIMIYLNMLAVVKRRYYRLFPYALLNPIYWVLHSIAAYKALWQLITRPYYWEKTFHGITRVSDDV